MRTTRILILGSLSLGVVGLFVLLGLIYFAPGVLTRGLQYQDYTGRADAIVVVEGDFPFRSLGALDLYLEGVAPLVVLPTEHIHAGLKKLHSARSSYGSMQSTSVRCYDRPFPASAIRVWGNTSRNTADELVALSEYLNEAGYTKVVLVTSDYHTRRTRILLDGLSMNLDAVVVATPYGGILAHHQWRKNPHTIGLVLAEYLKILVQWVCHR